MSHRKLKELILYLASKSEDDPCFSVPKLNSLLFYCDFTAYRRLGRSITGCTYRKLPSGPAPQELSPILEQIKQDGDCEEMQGDYFGSELRRVQPRRTPEISVFSDKEIQLADQIVSAHWRNSITGDDLGRDFIGWRVAAPNEVIPYETALVGDPMMPVSEDESEFCRMQLPAP